MNSTYTEKIRKKILGGIGREREREKKEICKIYSLMYRLSYDTLDDWTYYTHERYSDAGEKEM